MVACANDLLLYNLVESNADYSRLQDNVTTIDHHILTTRNANVQSSTNNPEVIRQTRDIKQQIK